LRNCARNISDKEAKKSRRKWVVTALRGQVMAQPTRSGRVEKSSPKKASPRKSPSKRRDPLTNTTGNRREWIPKEKWDEMRRTGTLPPCQKLYLIDDEDETEIGDQSDTGSTSSQMNPDTYALAGVTLTTPVKE
jgi:hypothetical protein